MKKSLIAVLLICVFVITACNPKYKNLEDGIYADIVTEKGSIVCQLYEKEAPITVASFITLAEGTNEKVTDSLKGTKYFNGLTFHRVVKDFVIQGGDPLANGRGGPGYKYQDEFAKDSAGILLHKHDGPGVLSMANPGPNSNGSQFFITHKATPWLDGKHTVFGKVMKGQEVVDSIKAKDKILSVNIVRLGNEAKSFDAVKTFNDLFKQYDSIEGKRLAEIAAKDKIRYDKFLAGKKVFEAKQGVKRAKETDSGLKILTLKRGKGKKVARNTKNTTHYKLYLADGTFIQNSRDRKQPFVFNLSQQPMITGFVEGILTMRAGGKARFFIPYYLAYGEQGGGPFPPKADIIFEIEILKVE